MVMHESSEDYLEMMLMLKEQKGYIRSVDIAEGLGVTKPSVSYAVKRLRESGYIVMLEDRCLELTEKGLAIAEATYERHKVIAWFLMGLGVSEETAHKDACKMEHDLSEETFKAMLHHSGHLGGDHHHDGCIHPEHGSAEEHHD
jgi:Mn-dependent DtxR family transcriptional regulator